MVGRSNPEPESTTPMDDEAELESALPVAAERAYDH